MKRGPYRVCQGLVKPPPKIPLKLWKTPNMPHVPASPCGTPGCPELRPCEDHPIKAWANSKQIRHARGATLPPHQETARRRKVLHIHRRICHICGEPFADQVDHVIPLAEGGPDTIDNLRPIHGEPCHRIKTAAEAARGRARAHRRT